MEPNYLHTSPSSSPSSESSDYINMDLDSFHSSLTSCIISHSSPNDFEFQSFSSSSDRDPAAASPADHLFFMGKLLPLQMVHKIEPFEQESFRTPIFTPCSNTPFESCNISPSDSCQVSGELNPAECCLDDEYLSEFEEKKSWTKKLKLVKKSSSFGSKLKWAYLKSLFSKSSCSNGCSDQRQLPQGNVCSKSVVKNAAPFGQIKSSLRNKDNLAEDCRGGNHRRSFSGTFKRLSKPKTSSASSSTNLSTQVFRSSELENPIQAAIAHCKMSQQEMYSKHAFCSISTYDDQERAGVCRG